MIEKVKVKIDDIGSGIPQQLVFHLHSACKVLENPDL